MKRITLITGGGRSGKSAYALQLANDYAAKAFIATAVPFDEELRERIRRHQRDRDLSFVTIEEPFDPAAVLQKLPPGTGAAIIDCLSVWIGNLLHRDPEAADFLEINHFLDRLSSPPCDLFIVTNEVGMGIIPDNALARRYRDLLGTLNRRIAALADRVVLMVSGIPLYIKNSSDTATEGEAPRD